MRSGSKSEDASEYITVEKLYELNYWEFPFVIDHFQRNENQEEYSGDHGIYSTYIEEKDQEVKWEVSQDVNTTWLRAYTVLEGPEVGEEVEKAVRDSWRRYLDSMTRDRVERLRDRSRETLGIREDR